MVLNEKRSGEERRLTCVVEKRRRRVLVVKCRVEKRCWR